MNYSGENTISGKEGRLFLDGNEMANVKSFEATIEKAKEDVNILGQRWMSKKSNGVSGTGTLTLYKATSEFIEQILKYANEGIDTYFSLQSVLDDKSSGRGTERVILYRVNLDSVKIAQLDVDTASLEEEIPFTFEGADLPERLKNTF